MLTFKAKTLLPLYMSACLQGQKLQIEWGRSFSLSRIGQ
jgi:hypothetical protein